MDKSFSKNNSKQSMKIFVVGCYGRGLLLAQQMVKKNLPTVYYDITDQMGHWSPDDWEGPFGFFRHESISEETILAWTAAEPPVEVQFGSSIVFNDLTFSAKSQLSSHLLAEHPEKEKYLKYISRTLTSTQFVENSLEPHGKVNQLDWSAPFSFRRRTRIGLQRSLEQLSDSGVEVFTKAQVKDVSLDSNSRIGSLEVALERNDVAKLSPQDQLVWCLSAQETKFILPDSFQKIVKSPLIEPLWFWARFRIRIEFVSEWTSWLPPYFILTDDLDAQWVRENFCILRQASSPDQWDCWMKLPVAQRFNSQYLKTQSERLEARLRNRFSHLQAHVIEWPQESRYAWHEVGPPTHPIWEKPVMESLKSFTNIHSLGIEQCSGHDFESKMIRENKVINEINVRYEAYLEKLKREQKL